MASTRTRTARDGTVSYAVLWREGNPSRQTSATFTGPDAEELAEGFKTRLELDGPKAAAAWVAKRQADAGKVETAGWTVDSWMRHYIAHLTGVEEGTRAEYTRLYARTYGRQLGVLPVDIVNKDKVSLATTALRGRLKHKSVLNAKGLLFGAFAEAVDRADVPVVRNPVAGVKLPKAGDAGDGDDDGAKAYLAHEEFARLYAEVPAYWQPLVLTLVSTGLRWSEATALAAGAVNLEAPTLRVSRAWKRIPGGWEIGPPKTRRSRRTVMLPAELVQVLRPLVEGRKRSAFVFTSRRGDGAVHHANFRQRVWVPAVERAKLARTPRIHDLRHTHVAWLVAQGVQLPVIQRRLGHESIQTTFDVYGDLMPDVQLQAAAAASAALASLQLESTSHQK